MNGGVARWKIDTAKDRKRVKRLIHAMLDARYDEQLLEMMRVAAVNAPDPAAYSSLIAPSLIEEAIAARDLERLVRLTDSPTVRRMAFSRFLRGPGAPAGKRKRTQLRDVWLPRANQQVDWALEALKRHCPGKTSQPRLAFAIEIVAVRCRALGSDIGIGVKELTKYRLVHGRSKIK